MSGGQLDLDFSTPPARTGQVREEPAVGSPVETMEILDVSELTRRVRTSLESQFGEVWVRGEVSNFVRHSSGHRYFTLKDEGAQIACVLFARTPVRIPDEQLQDGREVELCGKVTVYERRGNYQIQVREVRARGAGLLQARFEELKAKLLREGVFDESLKRPLPSYPSRVGVITSPTGAALRDFLNVLHRRNAGISVLIYPVRVQGEGAAEEMASALRDFSVNRRLLDVDLIVVTRGGGSLEDLWPFNEEAVARAIRAACVPVVSAVGHQVDFTICDFAADLRAPTPSAAAELIAGELREVLQRLSDFRGRQSRALGGILDRVRLRVSRFADGELAREPLRCLDQLAQRLDRASGGVRRSPVRWLSERKGVLALASRSIQASRVVSLANQRQAELSRAGEFLHHRLRERLEAHRSRLVLVSTRLRGLDPSHILARGYTITTDALTGQSLSSRHHAAECTRIRTRFTDGEVISTVDGPHESTAPPAQPAPPSRRRGMRGSA